MHYTLTQTSWDKHRHQLSEIRRKVFIEEQSVPEDLEWDNDDKQCFHILVTINNKPIATGRMKPDGHIGRMAVLKEHRNKGIGTAILNELIKVARKHKLNNVYLHAQTSAIPFYEKQNFKVYSDEFMDAGIPHKSMRLLFNESVLHQ